jgi:hypothetical protein
MLSNVVIAWVRYAGSGHAGVTSEMRDEKI